MRRLNGKAYACIVLVAAVFLAAGCSDDGNPVTPEEEPAEFRALTTPENLIYNLVLSYEALNIVEYSRLLLNTDDGDYGQEYYWFNQPEDVGGLGEEFYTRDGEIARTGNLFQAAKGAPVKPEHPVIDSYELNINPGTWTPTDSLWGEPCEDCWTTKRRYYIKIVVGADRIFGDDLVGFYVVPIEEGDVTTYRVAIAMDMRE